MSASGSDGPGEVEVKVPGGGNPPILGQTDSVSSPNEITTSRPDSQVQVATAQKLYAMSAVESDNRIHRPHFSGDDGDGPDGPSGQAPSTGSPGDFPGGFDPPSSRILAGVDDDPSGQPTAIPSNEFSSPSSRFSKAQNATDDDGDEGPGGDGPSTGGPKFPDGPPTPPSVKDYHAPAIPPEFSMGSSLLIQPYGSDHGQTTIEVIKPPVHVPKASDFAAYTTNDAKILYLETYELSSRLHLIRALVNDMKGRSQALADVASNVEALRTAINDVASMADNLYKTTGLVLYPPPGSLA